MSLGRAFVISVRWTWNKVQALPWESFGKFTEAVKNVIFFVALSIICYLAVHLAHDATKKVLLLDPIEVPKTLSERGLTSTVLTEQVRERLDSLEEIEYEPVSGNPISIATTNRVTVNAGSGTLIGPALPEVEIPETKLSLGSFMDILRDFLGTAPMHLGGEVTSMDSASKLSFRCRLLEPGTDVQIGKQQIIEIADESGLVDAITDQLLELTDPFLLGSYYVKTGKIAESKSLANRMQFERPDKDDMYSKAVLLRAFIDLTPNNPLIIGGYAYILEQQSKLAEAEVQLRRAVEISPHDDSLCTSLGVLLSKEDRLGEAADLFHHCMQIDPRFSYAHVELGVTLAKQKKFDLALNEFKTAIKITPKLALAHSELGNVLGEMDRYDESEEELRRAVYLEPSSAAFRSNLASALTQLYRFDDAIFEFENAIQLNAKLAAPHYGLGFVLLRQHKISEGIVELQKSIELDQKLSPPHDQLGLAFAVQGDLEHAIKELHTAVNLDPRSPSAHDGLGHYFLLVGQLKSAKSEFEQAIQLSSDFASPHSGLGQVLFGDPQGREQKLKDAEMEYKRAIELEPKFASPHEGLGYVYLSREDLDDASAEFRQSIELDSKYSSPHVGLAYVYLKQQGRGLDAISEAQKAIQIDPESRSANSYDVLGEALYSIGNRQEAIKAFRKSIKIDPKLATPHGGLAKIFLADGKKTEAIAERQKALELAQKTLSQ